ncbi:GerAB/ArcD/ProY family transporter [Paenibacillus sp.]|uniref:GerAB/ArcD/ProY family transporter n=1 Tax=Paenibacillus TaxID=44249 RepID=UPI00356850C9
MQRVTQLQLGLMFVLFHFSTATGFLMGLIFPTADYQGWLVILTAFAGGLLITYISFALAKRRPSEFLVHYGKELVGRWLHIILMIGFGFFFIHLAGLVLREITDFLIQVYLPTTPSWMVASLFAFVVSIAVRAGIEAIFRCASGFFFVIFGTASFIPFMYGKDLNFNRTIALFTHLNPGRLFSDTYPFIPWFGEMMLILFIFPYIHNSGKTFRSLLWSSAASSYFIEMSFLLCLLLFGPHVSAQLTYPVLEMIRFIRIGGFLENLDPIVVAIWLSSLFVKISILLYIPVFITAQLFRLKDTRPLTFSFGAIMLGLSMHIVDNSIELNQFLLHAWPTFALVMECLPLLYWIMSVIKKNAPTLK